MSRTIVLDMDETLVHTFDTAKSSYCDGLPSVLDFRTCMEYFSGRGYEFYIPGAGSHYGIYRPGMYHLLEKCYSLFDNVIIWSAGTKGYVGEIMTKIFKDCRLPDAIFARDFCEITSQGKYHKPLRKLSYLYDGDLEETLKNTLIVDDRKDTFIENPDNGILIPAWRGEKDDTTLFKLAAFLEATVHEDDFKMVDKKKVFK